MEKPTTDELIKRIENFANDLQSDYSDKLAARSGIIGACLRLCGLHSGDEAISLTPDQSRKLAVFAEEIGDPYLTKKICEVLHTCGGSSFAVRFEDKLKEEPAWKTRQPLSPKVPLSKTWQEVPEKGAGKKNPGSSGNTKSRIR